MPRRRVHSREYVPYRDSFRQNITTLNDILFLQLILTLDLFLSLPLDNAVLTYIGILMNINPLLFERSLGSLPQNVFAGLQTEKLLKSFRSTLRVRFDGGERAAEPGGARGSTSRARMTSLDSGTEDEERHSIWAHQAGVTALTVERFDGRR